jgi:hypothetical protein
MTMCFEEESMQFYGNHGMGYEINQKRLTDARRLQQEGKLNESEFEDG